ncbi:MAG: hypothetical protein ACRC5T_11735, partial [Cetobacterium sp.]
LSCYIYKYFVEEEYLPPIFNAHFSDVLQNIEAETTLNVDIENLVSHFNFDGFFYNRLLLKAFYYSFYYLDSSYSSDNRTLENSLKNKFEFETYFSKVFEKSELDRFYDYLHSSIFKNVYLEEISCFINILKICSGNFAEESVFLNDHILIWKKIILDSINLKITENDILKFENFILRIGFSKKQSHYLEVYELEFLKINIDTNTRKECINLYNEFKKYYWNISFTDVFMLYFLITSLQKKEKKDIFVLYKEIPKYLLNSLKEQLELKHSVNIKEFVNLSFFEEFKKNNNVRTVGVFKELNLLDNSLEVIHLDLKF